jgi:hypothetical protein
MAIGRPAGVEKSDSDEAELAKALAGLPSVAEPA